MKLPRLPKMQTVASDLRLARVTARIAPELLRGRPGSSHTIADVVEAQASRTPDAIALAMGDSKMTYKQLDERANRVARWASTQGIQQGDAVALLGGNRPEYVAHWLGFAKIGAVTALINNNLTGEALSRSVEIASAKHLIVDSGLNQTWAKAASGVDDPPKVWVADADASSGDFDQAIAAESPHPLDSSARDGITTLDNLFYIYTSGTTGLPKAARFSHHRFLAVAAGAKAMGNYKSADNIYCPLPLYHTVGGVMSTGGALLSGATAVLAPKFSASRFWTDCVDHEVTAFQYIGELCRYLLNSPSHPDERRHQIRVCIGNGLRPDIWEEFRDRFGLSHIIEFYGATEGNVTFFNLDDKVGSIGRSPALLRRAAGVHLIEYDIETQSEVRGADGFCRDAAPGQPGEAIAKITSAARFDGYSDKSATESKILRDVFEEGDAYFRTGDLLSHDSNDYFYFVDRIGDTFRWKGENVSTTEVAESLSSCPGVMEINVYGVQVPGHDGRAGMAALVVDDDFDLDQLAGTAAKNLPTYARPRFIRMLSEIDITGTLKYRKVDAVKEGFDPNLVTDPLYFLDPDSGSFLKLDTEAFTWICDSDSRI